jgi:adenine-specific DNA-methyltransferase
MDKLKMHTPDITQQNIDKLLELFPNCKTEKQNANGGLGIGIDFDLLKQELSKNIVEGPKERYQLNWPGKKEALLTANAPIAKTLRPCREESVDFDTTENLFIEGDNLDALKLLQETYLGKVKMIYIDPPYNTGKDFIYSDNFAESADEYLQKSGQKDDDGNRLVANTDSNGRFHSDWLSMMYPRLKLARNLLKDDGVIFISADDEVVNLKKICDEIFGEDNFIENITWNKRVPKNDKGIGNIHEYILLYAKDASLKPEFKMRKDGLDEIYDLVEKLRKKRVGFFEATEEVKKLYKKNGYDRGITLYNSFNNEYKLWGKINMSWPNADTFGPGYDVNHPISGNPVKIPERGWRWKKETFEEAAKIKNGQYTEVVELHDGSFLCGKIWFSSKDSQQPSSVTFLDDVNSFLLRSILSNKSDGGIEVERLFDGKSYFSYPKSTSLLKVLISSYSDSSTEDVILDFFSGSATTADAVIQTNAEDNRHRKFIMVQLPEECDEKTEAFKAEYSTIAEISKERIRRAGKQIKKDNPKATGLDTGFRVLKIDSSNMNQVHYTPDDVSKGDLFHQIDHIKADRSSEDLLFQVMLDWGVDLSLPIRKEIIEGKDVYFVNDDDLVACFDRGIDEALIKALAAKEPLRVVFRDDGFVSDSVKINVEQIFKQLAPATDIKAI